VSETAHWRITETRVAIDLLALSSKLLNPLDGVRLFYDVAVDCLTRHRNAVPEVCMPRVRVDVNPPIRNTIWQTLP
jgi:hypothetical protein